MKHKFLLISFFRITDPYSGASEVSFDFFKNIPNPKKLFQYSEKKKNYKYVISIKAKNKLYKIFYLFKLAKIICNHSNNQKNVIIFEGASWIGYTFILFKLIKNKFKNSIFIYHSHNVEYLLRKNKENYLIVLLTKYFEKYIAENFDIFTTVSKSDQNEIKNLYKINSQILSNGVNLKKTIYKIKPKNLHFKYILFSGSIKYFPNFDALNILINQVMPKVIKKNPEIKLVVTGNKYLPIKKDFLINAGFLTKEKFYQYLKGSSLFVNPMRIGFGSQVKIINSLMFGKTIISTKIGLKGIELNKKFKNIFLSKDYDHFAKLITNKINSKRYNKKISDCYINFYLMKNIVRNFLVKNNLL